MLPSSITFCFPWHHFPICNVYIEVRYCRCLFSIRLENRSLKMPSILLGFLRLAENLADPWRWNMYINPMDTTSNTVKTGVWLIICPLTCDIDHGESLSTYIATSWGACLLAFWWHNQSYHRADIAIILRKTRLDFISRCGRNCMSQHQLSIQVALGYCRDRNYLIFHRWSSPYPKWTEYPFTRSPAIRTSLKMQLSKTVLCSNPDWCISNLSSNYKFSANLGQIPLMWPFLLKGPS